MGGPCIHPSEMYQRSLTEAFDTMHCESLWEFLKLREIPTMITGSIANLYTGTDSTVKCDQVSLAPTL